MVPPSAVPSSCFPCLQVPTKENTKCSTFDRRGPAIYGFSKDTFLHQWMGKLFYLFPPYPLIQCINQKLIRNRTSCTLVITSVVPAAVVFICATVVAQYLSMAPSSCQSPVATTGHGPAPQSWLLPLNIVEGMSLNFPPQVLWMLLNARKLTNRTYKPNGNASVFTIREEPMFLRYCYTLCLCKNPVSANYVLVMAVLFFPHQIIKTFLKGMLNLHSPHKSLVPEWSLPLVLAKQMGKRSEPNATGSTPSSSLKNSVFGCSYPSKGGQ